MIVIRFKRTFTNDEFHAVYDLLEALSYYGDINVSVDDEETRESEHAYVRSIGEGIE